MTTQNFIDLCISGDALADQIDDYVERWHANEVGQSLELSEFLGMDDHEYAIWMRDSKAIYGIIKAHKFHKSVDIFTDDYFTMPLAARSESTEETQLLTNWLKKLGKIE